MQFSHLSLRRAWLLHTHTKSCVILWPVFSSRVRWNIYFTIILHHTLMLLHFNDIVVWGVTFRLLECETQCCLLGAVIQFFVVILRLWLFFIVWTFTSSDEWHNNTHGGWWLCWLFFVVIERYSVLMRKGRIWQFRIMTLSIVDAMRIH